MDPLVSKARSDVGHAIRWHGADSPEAAASRRNLEALNAAQKVDALVASWPELSDEKLNRIAGLLRAGARSDKAPK